MPDPVEISPGRWRVRVFLGEDVETKRQQRRQVTFKADGIRRARAEARRIEGQVRAELAAEASKRLSVAEAAERWWALWERRPRSPTTRRGYRSILDHHVLTSPLAKMQVERVRTGHVEDWYADLPVGPSTVRRIHAVLAQVLDQCVRDGLLERNPATLAYKPESRAQAKTSTPVETVMLVLAAAHRRHPIRARLLAFAALTGLRRGELCGVRWSGFELDQGVLIVEHNVVVARGQFADRAVKQLSAGMVLKGPKAHQIAAIALKDQAVDIVAEQMAWQSRPGFDASMSDEEAERREGPFLWSPTPPFDVPLHPDTASNWFAQAAKDAGVRGVSLHDLRHWKASQTLEVGGTLEDVRAALRHRSLQTTMRYVHADQSKQKVLVDLLPRLELPQ